MTREIALEYIKKTRLLGFADQVIRRELEKSGWPASEIDLAFIESRANDQKPAVEPADVKFAPRTQPQWEEKSKETFDTNPKPIDLTKASFARPAEDGATSKSALPSTPSGSFSLSQKPVPEPAKPISPQNTVPTSTGPARITQIPKSPFTPQPEIKITPANELSEPPHLPELPAKETLPAHGPEKPEPLVMGVPASQLIKPQVQKQPEPLIIQKVTDVAKTPEPVPVKITKTEEIKVPEVPETPTPPPRFQPMQEEVVSDLVDESFIPSQVNQPAVRSTVLEQIGLPPRSRNHRVAAVAGAVAFFFIVSGASAGLWYYQTTWKPQAVVQEALNAAATMKSYRYDAELRMSIQETSTTLGKSLQPFVPPLASLTLGALTAQQNEASASERYTFTMRAKGAVDIHDEQNPKNQTTLTLGVEDIEIPGVGTLSSNVEFESRFLDGTYYFQIAKLPYFDSAAVDPSIPRFTSADITGRWVSVNLEAFEKDFNQYVTELSEIEPSFIGYHLDFEEDEDLITKKQKEELEKLWGETRLVVWDSNIIREQENGRDLYRVKGLFDKASFQQFMLKAARITGGPTSSTDEQNVDELFSTIGDVEVNAWVGKDSKVLERLSFKGVSTAVAGAAEEGVIEFDFTTEFADIGKSLSFETPKEHYDLKNLLEKLFAYAREGFVGDSMTLRDAQRVSDLSRIRVALELYRKREGGYPSSLGVLVSEYIAVLPTDPLTKKPYRYTRTSRGYTLSAQLEDVTNPILKSDLSPTNTLYDIGPGL